MHRPERDAEKCKRFSDNTTPYLFDARASIRRFAYTITASIKSRCLRGFASSRAPLSSYQLRSSEILNFTLR